MNRQSFDAFKPRFTRVKRNYSAPHALPRSPVSHRHKDKVKMIHLKLHEMGFTAITPEDIKQTLLENNQNVNKVIDIYVNFFRSASPKKMDKVDEVYDKLHEMGVELKLPRKSVEQALAHHHNNVERVIQEYLTMTWGQRTRRNKRNNKRKPTKRKL